MEYSNYTIESDGTFSMYVIKPKGRGSVPSELRGRYTTRELAMKAIDTSEKAKEMKHGKKGSVG